MKHTDWLRLRSEGESICAVLKQQGYQCRKQVHCLSWKISQEGNSYVLTWLPAPIGEWSLIPSDTNPAREQIWAVVQSVLKANEESQKIAPQSIRQPEDFTRPWAIVRLLPNAQRYTVARFFNRQDADDHKRVLNRFMPIAEFEVVFDVPDEKELDDEA
ncbi:MAG: hypothetical protein M3O33_18915 [Cyanobacteriota bacterium]|nr:hypothetical protein [Cyanobacteriota bacterium]